MLILILRCHLVKEVVLVFDVYKFNFKTFKFNEKSLTFYQLKFRAMKNIFILLTLISFNAFGQQPIKVEIVESRGKGADPVLVESFKNMYESQNPNYGETLSNSIQKSYATSSASSARAAGIRGNNTENYIGEGIYEIIRYAGNGFKRNKESYMTEKLIEDINEFRIQKGAQQYEIVSKNFNPFIWGQKSAYLNAKVKFKDGDGNVIIDEKELMEASNLAKEDARKELLELKELLDLGLITQEEFDEKAVELKKIILDK